MRRSQWPFSRISLLISSFMSRTWCSGALSATIKAASVRSMRRRRRSTAAPAQAARCARNRQGVATRAGDQTVLNHRNLLRDLLNDLTAPALGVGEVVAVRRQVRPPLLLPPELLLLHRHPPRKRTLVSGTLIHDRAAGGAGSTWHTPHLFIISCAFSSLRAMADEGLGSQATWQRHARHGLEPAQK